MNRFNEFLLVSCVGVKAILVFTNIKLVKECKDTQNQKEWLKQKTNLSDEYLECCYID